MPSFLYFHDPWKIIYEITCPKKYTVVYQTNLNATNGSRHSTLPRDLTTRLPGENGNGMNGSHTMPKNSHLYFETTQIDGASVNLKSLMGQDLLSSTQNNPATKEEWFV